MKRATNTQKNSATPLPTNNSTNGHPTIGLRLLYMKSQEAKPFLHACLARSVKSRWKPRTESTSTMCDGKRLNTRTAEKIDRLTKSDWPPSQMSTSCFGCRLKFERVTQSRMEVSKGNNFSKSGCAWPLATLKSNPKIPTSLRNCNGAKLCSKNATSGDNSNPCKNEPWTASIFRNCVAEAWYTAPVEPSRIGKTCALYWSTNPEML